MQKVCPESHGVRFCDVFVQVIIMPVGHLPTVDRDRPILAKLLFCFMYLANEIDEALS